MGLKEKLKEFEYFLKAFIIVLCIFIFFAFENITLPIEIDWIFFINNIVIEKLQPIALLLTLVISLFYLSEKQERAISFRFLEYSIIALSFTLFFLIVSLSWINILSWQANLISYLGRFSFTFGVVLLSLSGLTYFIKIPPKFGFLIYPQFKEKMFSKEEKTSSEITVPPRKKIILYFHINFNSPLGYEDPMVWVSFNKKIKIVYNLDYEKLFFGKPPTILKDFYCMIKLQGIAHKETINVMVFPIVIKTPSKGTYKVDLEFTAKNIKSTFKKTLNMIVDKNITHDSYYFDYKNFKPSM